jgi:hypothetical protein
MELTFEKKPIKEYKLTNPTETQAKKGHRGFVKKQKPKDIQITLRMTTDTKLFLNEYCKVNDISITSLLLAGIECYTGYNGSNHKEIIQECKEWNNCK